MTDWAELRDVARSQGAMSPRDRAAYALMVAEWGPHWHWTENLDEQQRNAWRATADTALGAAVDRIEVRRLIGGHLLERQVLRTADIFLTGDQSGVRFQCSCDGWSGSSRREHRKHIEKVLVEHLTSDEGRI